MIKEINEQSIWQKFFEENNSPSFLQSWEWGEFEKKMGDEILRLGISHSNKLQAIALVIKIRAKRGNFLFIPHGPIFSISNFKFQISNLLDYLINLAKKEDYSFIRIAPILENRGEYQKIFEDLGFKTAPIYMHAERVWILPLTKSLTKLQRPEQVGQYLTDEELLSAMRKTTRYLIKKAIRDGVTIEKRTDEAAVDDFYKIYEETAKRENFVPFSKNYVKNEFGAFHKTENAVFLFGKINPLTVEQRGAPNKYLAAALILFTQSTAFYHQGASIHTKIPVTYLLQWEAIREAKKRGCQFYNFWGILQEGKTPKNWEGLTLFKKGFGGHQIDYLPTQDYIISPKYYFTYVYEKILQWKRGV